MKQFLVSNVLIHLLVERVLCGIHIEPSGSFLGVVS